MVSKSVLLRSHLTLISRHLGLSDFTVALSVFIYIKTDKGGRRM